MSQIVGKYRTTRLVRFGDCDLAGMVYFPRYLDLLNGIVEDWWSELGFPWSDLIRRRQVGLPTVHLNVDFRAPSRLGDILSFDLQIGKLGRTSITLLHTISGGDGVRCAATQVVVAISMETRAPQPWPPDIRVALETFKQAGGERPPAHLLAPGA